MSDLPSKDRPSLKPAQTGGAPEIIADSEVANDSEPTKKLSAEEQMALYEEDLKETDWGHQPC